ncbi:hypothetical protein BU14_0052s0033 [Porphyra umbilicalis]|uniref:Uncharacterized protein n=1 Tax=Porphyra umbilicalis TaxID=2786 RepID=A0A1X6PHW4_PORUM|nr:hypothetical protein BU14_0052s0033 [Porphyra umbilicalis]|eukprot:OSX80417.1 hypothetical protein BU14_0052s0033 [Porphyra umbilicalis]
MTSSAAAHSAVTDRLTAAAAARLETWLAGDVHSVILHAVGDLHVYSLPAFKVLRLATLIKRMWPRYPTSNSQRLAPTATRATVLATYLAGLLDLVAAVAYPPPTAAGWLAHRATLPPLRAFATDSPTPATSTLHERLLLAASSTVPVLLAAPPTAPVLPTPVALPASVVPLP